MEETIQTIETDDTGIESGYLNTRQAAQFLGLSRNYLFKLTMGAEIAHFKPNGKTLFFKKSDLVEWIERNRTRDQRIFNR